MNGLSMFVFQIRCLIIQYNSGIQPGVRVPAGVRENIQGMGKTKQIYIIFHDKHIN
jgi:hypothetical protein